MFDLNNIANITKEQFAGLSPEEQKLVIQILGELSKDGRSQTLDDLWYQDYTEIPVSIKEFITNPHYLGKSTRNGESIYPYWRQKYNEIFDESLGYEEVVLTGAIGVGKTRTAVVCLAYLLYKIMCLKNPQEYFKFNEGDKITIFFLNINLKLAEGVGFKTLHQYLLNSPWFMERGTQTGRTNLIYNPPHNIGITFGSKSDHALGQQVFCLSGDTKIYTDNGIFEIQELVNTQVRVFTYNPKNHKVELSNPVWVRETKVSQTYKKITFNNGTEIRCTENHRWLLTTGKYKETQDLTIGDKLQWVGSVPVEICSICDVYNPTLVKFYDVINVKPYHNFIVKCGNTSIVSHNCAFMDEVDFTKGGIKGGDVLSAQNGIMQAYTTIKERINSRFIKNGVQYGRLFLVSSKKSEHDFIEAYIRKMQSEGQADKMLIVDEPQWVIKPPGTFSKETFPVAVGNRSLKSRILPDNISEEERKAIIKQGYEILDVPVSLKQSFIIDVNTALMNLAGRSVVGATSFFNFDMFSKCYIQDYHNPFTTDIITTGIQDDLQIANFFDINSVPEAVRAMPQFIHIDASLTGDKTGISSVGASGLKDTIQYNGANEILTQELTYKHIFSVDIQAPQGSEISFEKTRQFIYFLKASGFNIKAISLDGFQSADMKQMLLAQGYDASIISLDKTPQGYLALRSAMNDGRIGLIQIDLLETELIQLQRDLTTGKIDHPIGGCFTSDTKISLVDGRTVSIEQLMEEQSYKTNYVYTINEDTLKIEPKPIKKVFQTKIVKHLLKVTLDNGQSIYCTPEHRFMLRDGSYLEAQNLYEGCSLMPLYTEVDTNNYKGYRKYYEPADNTWKLEHLSFCNKGNFRTGNVVHHLNYDKLNNVPYNLISITRAQHSKIHNLSTRNYTKVSESMKHWHNVNKNTQLYKERNLQLKKSVLKYFTDKHTDYVPREILEKQRITAMEDYFGIDWNMLSTREKNSYSVKFTKKFPQWKKRKSILNTTQEESKRFEKIAQATSNRMWITNGTVNKYILKNDVIPEGFHYGRTMNIDKNHKVVQIEHIIKPCRVFDLEIVDNHNFALAAGVFVHNSKDMSDSLAGALWNATLHKQSLVDGLELLSTALDVNDLADPKQEFINELQSSMSQQTILSAQTKMDELLSGFGNADILGW